MSLSSSSVKPFLTQILIFVYRFYFHVFYMKKYIYIYMYVNRLNILSKVFCIVIHLQIFKRLTTNFTSNFLLVLN